MLCYDKCMNDNQAIAPSLAAARIAGAKFYARSKPCKHGNVACRSVQGNRCQCLLCKEDVRRRDAEKYKRTREQRIAYQSKRYVERNAEIRAAAKLSWWRNREKHRALDKQRYEKNKIEDNLRRSEHYRANKPATRLRIDKWYLENKSQILSRNRLRDAQRAFRTPQWFSELDSFVVEQAYSLCDERSLITGIKWELDHMLPLCAKNVSGLHVWNNVQVIPKIMNREKRHRTLWVEPLDWMERL